MILFFVGILEMMISSLWTRYVSNGRMWFAGLITFINIFIWFYVLKTVLEHLNDNRIVILYATGCAIGTVLGTRLAKGS